MGKIKYILSVLQDKYHQLITPSIKYAKELGVTVGEDNYIPDKHIWPSEPYLITIGNHCQITSGVRLFTHGGGSAVRNLYPEFDIFGKIVIGDWVYIGNNSLIMPGVTIDDNVIVAAGSVVTKSIPSGVVVAGNPARIICTIEEFLKKNAKYNTNSGSLSQAKRKEMLLSMDNSKFIKKNYLERIEK